MDDLKIYCDDMETKLKDWDIKLEKLKIKSKMVKGAEELELGDEINFLEMKKQALEKMLGDLRGATGDTCLLIKNDMEEAFEDMVTSFERAISRFI